MAKKHPLPDNNDTQHSALADLLRAKGFAESAPPAAPKPEPAIKPGASAIDLSRLGKIVLQRERKGRGGKTVTIVSGLNLPAPRLEQLAREMRKGLGCGSTVESGTIVLQGDIVPRAQEWLRKHGAVQIVIGN
jgi:predicted translation initiation factor SUI1